MAIGAMIGAGVLGAGATVYAAGKAGDVAETQAQAATRAADEGIAAELEMYYQSREDLAPWREFGEKQLGRAENLLAKGRGEFEFDQPPTLDIMTKAASGTIQVWLDLIQIRAGR